MHLQLPILLLLIFSSTSSATQDQTAYVVKERVNTSVYHAWSNVGVPSPTHILNLRIALPQSNYSALEDLLYRVSSPESPQYGQFLTKSQVEHLVQPHEETVSTVENWLVRHGIDVNKTVQRSPAGDWLKLMVPVTLAERMLSTKYHVWEHSDGTRIVRTTQYSLPANLHSHIDFVQPTTIFSRGSVRRPFYLNSQRELPAFTQRSSGVSRYNRIIDEGCRTKVTVSCLKQIYNITNDETSQSNTNTIGVTGYLDQFANKEDLRTFFFQQRPDALNSTFKEIYINGGNNSQSLSLASPEADLDVQFAFGLSYPIPGVFYSTGGLAPFRPDANEPDSSNEPYLDWVEYLLAQTHPPQTITTSYGDDEQTVPRNYAVRICRSFAQLGARGVSLLFGSGDSGVAGSNPETQICLANDGTNRTRFIPNFPASCPFVTTVGATQGFDPETATTRFASGGGFSEYFARPAYAELAVTNFFRQFPSDTYPGLFNVNGAPIPDVSAQGDHYQIIWQGVQVGIGGASAATPTFAAIIAIINSARIQNGKPSLGWLNPMLYTVGLHGLNDIVVGSNPGCDTPGFNATVGWDPVTGLGTPNFPKLKEIILGIP
ncbi:tripeptidyl peptidase A [Irpex lacteus]|nr:tripeptidyl peptidase A [Irpex lacteus]